MPSRTLPTRFLTGAWRWEVPRREVPVAASASSASVRTLEGPAPKRPSAGLMSAGIWISATSGAYRVPVAVPGARPPDETRGGGGRVDIVTASGEVERTLRANVRGDVDFG